MPLAETAELVARLVLDDRRFYGPMTKVQRQLKTFDKLTTNTQKALGRTADNLGRLATVGLAATAAGFIGVVKAAADYESAFAGVRKTVEATEPELSALSDAIRRMAREMPIAATELAALGEAGGALGIATEDLEEFIRVTALLGVTTDLTSEQAAESLGVLSNVLKLTGEDYDNFASTLVALGNAGASTESAIIQVAQRMGAAGELIGLTTEQVLGFASAAASLDPSSIEASGSALQKFFIDTTKSVAAAGDELDIFAKTAGTSSKQFARDFEENAGAALQDFLAGLGELDKAAQLRILEDLGFNDSRITRVLLGLANNTRLVTEQMNLANKSWAENSALGKEAAERFKTFDSQMVVLKNNLKDVAIVIGTALLPKLTPLIQRLTQFLIANQGKIEQFATDFAEGFGKFADEISKADFTPLIDGLKLTVEIAKRAIDLFKSLPAPIQQLLIAGAAVNKVTGGLVTAIGKDLFGALLKMRGQTPVNPMFVSVVGGVPGAGGGLPGAAAGAGLGVVGLVTVAAVVPLVLAELGLTLADLPQVRAGAEAGQLDRDIARWEARGGRGPRPTGNGLQPPIGPGGVWEKWHREQAAAAAAALGGGGRTNAEQSRAATTAARTQVAAGAALARSLTNASVALRDFTEKARGTQGRNAFLGSTTDAAGARAMADYLAGRFAQSNAPFYNDMANAERTLAAMKAAQDRFAASGDTKTAASIAANIRSLEATIASEKAVPVVKTMVRVTEAVKTVLGQVNQAINAGTTKTAAVTQQVGGQNAAGLAATKAAIDRVDDAVERDILTLRNKKMTANVTVPVSVRTGGVVINGRVLLADIKRQYTIVRPGTTNVAV